MSSHTDGRPTLAGKLTDFPFSIEVGQVYNIRFNFEDGRMETDKYECIEINGQEVTLAQAGRWHSRFTGVLAGIMGMRWIPWWADPQGAILPENRSERRSHGRKKS